MSLSNESILPSLCKIFVITYGCCGCFLTQLYNNQLFLIEAFLSSSAFLGRICLSSFSSFKQSSLERKINGNRKWVPFFQAYLPTFSVSFPKKSMVFF